MSRRLIVVLACVAVAVGAGVVASIAVSQTTAPLVGAEGDSAQSVSDMKRREEREKFFSGDATRDIRSGQEMKPRW